VLERPSDPSSALPAAFHVDCDGARAIYRVHGWEHPWHDDPLFTSGMRQALDFFDRRGVRATFFVIAEALDRSADRALLEEAVRRGHEIGSHTTTHRQLTRLAHADKVREIMGSKESIEGALGAPCTGFRAPAFDLDPEVLELAAAAGYLYDSSLFPDRASARKAGVARVSPLPHRLRPDAELLELPLPRHRPLPLPFHPCYSLVLGGAYFRMGLRAAARTRAPLVVLFHLTDFADPLPKDRTGPRGARFFTLSHIDGAEKRRRLELMAAEVARRYRIIPTREILAVARDDADRGRSH
jgi:peptidoglycan/xylan/chitin deacetylase (PgdA/CDA1 family)